MIVLIDLTIIANRYRWLVAARFPDPTLADAILDRLVHNSYRLSYRVSLRES